MRELRSKIWEALLSALPITAIVYVMARLSWFRFSGTELVTFTVGAVLLILGIGVGISAVLSDRRSQEQLWPWNALLR